MDDSTPRPAEPASSPFPFRGGAGGGASPRARRAKDRPADAPDPLALMGDMLTAQARSLDGLFAELVGQAERNMTKWPLAAQTYARLAFQAQWNCRATLEAMARADRLAEIREEDRG